MSDKSEKIIPVKTREGSYKILLTLGSGGFGKVYSGRDEKSKRNVAIKVRVLGAFFSPSTRMTIE